jgi:histidinol phosphatase-like PHP family hydrolase
MAHRADHSHFDLGRREMSDRIVRAMRNPHADILFHPTGRKLQKRFAYDLDLDAVIAAARETGTVLADDVLNTRPPEEFLAALKDGPKRARRSR